MNFFVYILFFFLINFSANALSIKCHFEEVHQNGDVNQGIFFLKNEELRYEYFDEKLFTILYANKKLFAVENTEYRKELQHNEVDFRNKLSEIDDLKKWKDGVTKALWIIFGILATVIVRMLMMHSQQG